MDTFGLTHVVDDGLLIKSSGISLKMKTRNLPFMEISGTSELNLEEIKKIYQKVSTTLASPKVKCVEELL